MLSRSVELWLGLIFLALAALAFFVWVPFDSETPPIYTFRRTTYIGDAMLPMVAAGGILICAAIHVVLSFRRRDEQGSDAPFDMATAVFMATFFLRSALSRSF